MKNENVKIAPLRNYEVVMLQGFAALAGTPLAGLIVEYSGLKEVSKFVQN